MGFGPTLECPKDCDWYNRYTRVHGEVKRAFLEGKQSAVAGTRTFREDHHVKSFSENLNCDLHALDSCFTISPVNWYQLGQSHPRSEYWNTKQLFLD